MSLYLIETPIDSARRLAPTAEALYEAVVPLGGELVDARHARDPHRLVHVYEHEGEARLVAAVSAVAERAAIYEVELAGSRIVAARATDGRSIPIGWDIPEQLSLDGYTGREAARSTPVGDDADG